MVLLREVDRRLGLTRRLADCFADGRQPGKVEHSVRELVAQRVHGIALGYEDLNDHDALRAGPMLASGKSDLTGAGRARVRDRGYPLAGSSTLNRLELGGTEADGKRHRQKRAGPKRPFLSIRPPPVRYTGSSGALQPAQTSRDCEMGSPTQPHRQLHKLVIYPG